MKPIGALLYVLCLDAIVPARVLVFENNKAHVAWMSLFHSKTVKTETGANTIKKQQKTYAFADWEGYCMVKQN